MTSARTAATAAALTATLGLAAASWAVAVRQMNGMDMALRRRWGSFASFVALWVPMIDTGRAANWAVGGRPISRHRGVCIIDGSDDPGVATYIGRVYDNQRQISFGDRRMPA